MPLKHKNTKFHKNKHVRQMDIPIIYDGLTFEEGLRLDLLVEDKVKSNM